MHLNRDAPLLFEVHRIQMLIRHHSFSNRAGEFEQPIRQRRLPMINMGNNAKITCERGVFHLSGEVS